VAYQSLQFELITNDIRRPIASKLEDLITKNFTFYTASSYWSNIINAEVNRSIEWKTIEPLNIFTNMIEKYHDNSSVQYAFLVTKRYISSYVNRLKNGKSFDEILPIKVLPEKFSSYMIGHGFTATSPFYDFVENINEKLITAGIVQKTEKDDNDFCKLPDSEGEPTVFNLEILGFGFVVWLGSCIISTLGFFLELAIFRLRFGVELKRRRKNYFLRVLGKF
jgi:hypothetical protein